MTPCEHIFHVAEATRKHLDAPTMIIPSCHPRSHCDVFVDTKNSMIVITCAKCERMVDCIRVKLDKP